MSGAAALLIVLTLVVAVVDWIAVYRDQRAVEYVAKPLTMVVLIAAALAINPVDDAVRVAFVVALVFSLAGDVFLMLPRNLFVAGLAAFLVGHLAYVVGLQLRGQSGLWFVIGLAVVLLAVVFIGARILRAVRAGDEPALAVPVTAYIAVISLMVASAFGTRNLFAIVGASLFYSSDALIAWNRFVTTLPQGRVAIMITYHLGQIGLVLSLV
jgi:alkenylglycerophosphocholine/alkenylglycerophosphoethanolamine hydrolase